MEVRYEDLVADPEPLLRRIAGFVDLPWDDGDARLPPPGGGADEPEMARDLKPLGAARSRPRSAPASTSWSASPPSQSRVGRWRTEMSPEDRAAFESVAGKMLKKLGYELE